MALALAVLLMWNFDMSIELTRLSFTAEALNGIPATERGLLMFTGHAINELNVLNKWLLLSTDIGYPELAQRHALVCQQLLLFKMIDGKLHEAWAAIKDGYFATKLSLVYNADLPPESLQALDSLKRRLGREANSIGIVRNNFAFHYSLQHASQDIPADADPKELVAYVGEPIGHSLYEFAEATIGRALLGALDFDRAMVESQATIGDFNNFAHGLMIAILERHGLLDPNRTQIDKIELQDVPAQEQMRLDYFFRLDEHDEMTL